MKFSPVKMELNPATKIANPVVITLVFEKLTYGGLVLHIEPYDL